MQIRFHSTREDLISIRSLQSINLRDAVSVEEREAEGFVTCIYDEDMLGSMCGEYKHVVAWEGDVLAGYTLCMLESALKDYPVLQPMCDQFKLHNWLGKPITELKFAVVGQICVAKGFRRMGLLQDMYRVMQKQLKSDYDLLLTEVDAVNIPSIKAHLKAGFKEITRHKEQNGRSWVIVGLEL
jgi:ribosomal protein S18 acetylase RimI-like enzyme